MADSRTDILNRVRQNRASAIELPSLDHSWQRFDDSLAHFRQVLTSIGGNCEIVRDPAAADAWLQAHDEYAAADCCLTLVDGVGRSTLSLDQLPTPHETAGLDWAVLPGEFAVAENGAIWITDHTTRHRAVYFLCEHLVLVVPRDQVFDNMHQAYQRLAGFGGDESPPFGTFIAGPSKTADIEQSLVIGAQGPRSLDVLIVREL